MRFKAFIKSFIVITLVIFILVDILEIFAHSFNHMRKVIENFDDYSRHAEHISHHIDNPDAEKIIHEGLYDMSRSTGAFLSNSIDLYSKLIQRSGKGASHQEVLNATEAIINYTVVETVKSYEDRSFYVQRMQGIHDVLERATFQSEAVRIQDIDWLLDQTPLLAHGMAQSLSGMPMGLEEARAYLEKIAQNGALQAQAFLHLKDDLEKSRRYVRVNRQAIDDTIILSDVSSMNYLLYWLTRLFIW